MLCFCCYCVLSLFTPPGWPTNKGVCLESSRPEFEFHKCCGSFSGSSHAREWKIGTPVAAVSGLWCWRASAWTGWHSVSILWLDELESLICNVCLSVTAHTPVWADPSLRYSSILLGYKTTNKESVFVYFLCFWVCVWSKGLKCCKAGHHFSFSK